MTTHARARPTAWRAAVGAVAVVAVVVVTAPRAHADTPDRCAAHAEHGQAARDAGHLLDARDDFRECARDTCPGEIRRDCARWLAEVETDLPSVVVGAQDEAGHDRTDASVTVDGAPVPDLGSGRAIALDPGRHVVRVEAAWARAPVEETILLRMGERNRSVVGKLVTAAPAPRQPLAGPPASSTSSASRASSASGASASGATSSLPLALAGVGALGATGFVFFGATGLSLKHDLESRCAPGCTDAEIAPVRWRYVAADVSLGVSVISFAAALWIWVRQRDAQPSQRLARIIWK